MSTLTALNVEEIGLRRSLDPPGALPHAARRLDAETPPGEYEAAVAVEMLAVDATSFRTIRERCDSDPERMASTILEIVAERGKLQNPWTSSGGVLLGRIETIGPGHAARELAVGDRVVPLASLIAIPLRLETVGPVDPESPHVPARGRAIVTGRMACAKLPRDLRTAVAVSALDVYPAASYARALPRPGDHVLVMGTGHAGLLGVAAAREAVGPQGTVTAVDLSPTALARASAVDPAVNPIQADARDPLAVAGELESRGLRPADLTLLCTVVPGCEGTAMLATSRSGAVLFFSTATSFHSAALGADAIGSQAQLIIPNGLTDDRGEYSFELLRRNPALMAAFEGST